MINGCQGMPNNNVFNTRIDNLPVHPNNALWMSNIDNGINGFDRGERLSGSTVLSTDPSVPMNFVYSPNPPGGTNFIFQPFPDRVSQSPEQRGRLRPILPGIDNHFPHHVSGHVSGAGELQYFQTGAYPFYPCDHFRAGVLYSLESNQIPGWVRMRRECPCARCWSTRRNCSRQQLVISMRFSTPSGSRSTPFHRERKVCLAGTDDPLQEAFAKVRRRARFRLDHHRQRNHYGFNYDRNGFKPVARRYPDHDRLSELHRHIRGFRWLIDGGVLCNFIGFALHDDAGYELSAYGTQDFG